MNINYIVDETDDDIMMVIDETELNNKVQNIYDNDDDIKHKTEKNNKCDIIVDDFVMVKFETIKKNIEMFIGQVSEIDQNDYTCKFLRKNNKMTGFYCFPFIIDEATITKEHIVKKMVIKNQRRGNFQFE